MFTERTEMIRAVMLSHGYRFYHGNFAVTAWKGDQCVAGADYPVGPLGPAETPEIREVAYESLYKQVYGHDFS